MNNQNERHIERGRQIDTDRQRERHKGKLITRENGGQTDNQTGRKTHKKKCKQMREDKYHADL